MGILILFELVSLILITTLCLIITIAIQVSAIAKKFPLLFYLRLASWFLVLYFLTDIISIILKSDIFARVHIVLIFPFTFFFILFVNNILKESYYTFGLIMVCCLGFLLIFLGTQPNAVQLVIEMGFEKYVPNGLFNMIHNVLYFIFIMYFFFWGFKTWSSSPFYLKEKALINLIGTSIYVFGGLLFHILYYINPIFKIFMIISNLIGMLIMTIVITKNVKILYVLPYTIYTISVRDHKGNPLFDHDWSESSISETVFSGFLNAIEIMSEEIMHMGGILDINLNKGILFVNRSKYITIGLVASNASKLLRDCVINFANDFENKFERLLKKSCIDMNEYKLAYELINKYFSNIPYRIFKNKDQVLTLSYKYNNIPKQIKNKFKDIFNKEDEYENVLNELIKTPCSDPSEFFDLFKELKLEIDELDLKDSREQDKKTYLN